MSIPPMSNSPNGNEIRAWFFVMCSRGNQRNIVV
jgi:hypothetical protein